MPLYSRGRRPAVRTARLGFRIAGIGAITQDYVILCLAALVAGAVNSIAGGATLLTFPLLYAALGSTATAAVVANGTNTVALVPAATAALAGYRREIRHEWYWATRLLLPSLLGGLLGSILVVALPAESFQIAIPWLILAPRCSLPCNPGFRAAGSWHASHAPPSARLAAGAMAFQFAVGVYGGYFCAGIGILMLAAWP